MKNCQNTTLRKRLQNFSYCPSNNIGKGYSSYVYKGRNDLTDETVAIKVIDMKMLKGQVHKNLLASEIQALKSLKRCNHIIDVHHIYSTKNATYIITQFCQGGDLSRVISGKRGMPESDAIDLLKQIVDGYSDIFSQRIIHRDLKPANILLKDNKVKIADFGFAMKSVDSKKFSSYNVGSPIYMPPEALNDNRYTYKSDVWAIGVIFFELLTGKAPWRAKTQKELGRQLTSVPISKLLPKNISEASSQFLQRALCVNYDKRMSPQELERYMNVFKGESFGYKKSVIQQRNQSLNHRPFEKSNSCFEHQDTSLNKNTIYQPKNMRALTFLKGNAEENKESKNITLPKTASTAHNNTETTFSIHIDKKQISKQLLSQIHFCRFVYKLLQRIQNKLKNRIGDELKDCMSGIIFEKLGEVENLTKISSEKAKQYKKTQQYQKVKQIVKQYVTKYQKQLDFVNPQSSSFKAFEGYLKVQLSTLYSQIQQNPIEQMKDHVVILDYLITLKQLVHLIQKYDVETFHAKSKIQAIVEGTPSKHITEEHLQGITTKLRAIKII